MTIRRIATSLLVAILTVLFSFNAATAPYSVNGGLDDYCDHRNLPLLLLSESYSCINNQKHIWTGHYYERCQSCGDIGYTDITREEAHFYYSDLVEHHHEGTLHYYTYRYGCKCGYNYTESHYEHCGNPCGKIHLSVPDEDI